MNKHNRYGGFHIAKLIPLEVVGFGAVLALMPKVGFFVAVMAAGVLVYATYSVFRAIRAVLRQAPTALGYGDVAARSARKAAIKTKTTAQTATSVAKPKVAI